MLGYATAPALLTFQGPLYMSALINNARLNLQVFYVESMSNPLIQVADLSAVAAFCKKRGLTPVVDNTFASPVLCTPASMGFIVIHSATKYLNGHSDLLAGVVSGPQKFIEQARSWPSYQKYMRSGRLLQEHGSRRW